MNQILITLIGRTLSGLGFLLRSIHNTFQEIVGFKKVGIHTLYNRLNRNCLIHLRGHNLKRIFKLV